MIFVSPFSYSRINESLRKTQNFFIHHSKPAAISPGGQTKPVAYQRDNIDFGDKPASVITEVGLGKFCASACQLAATAEMLRNKRYADDISDSIRSILRDRSDGKKQFLAIRKDLIEACKTYGFKI